MKMTGLDSGWKLIINDWGPRKTVESEKTFSSVPVKKNQTQKCSNPTSTSDYHLITSMIEVASGPCH
jgi:hypothetical protein